MNEGQYIAVGDSGITLTTVGIIAALAFAGKFTAKKFKISPIVGMVAGGLLGLSLTPKSSAI